MGFMDKAKKLAEQAQQKLDETQKNINKSGSAEDHPQEGGVKYDEHGRPIQEAPPAAATPPPAAEPTQEQPAADAPAPPAPAPPEQGQGDGTNASPDPFKPIQ